MGIRDLKIRTAIATALLIGLVVPAVVASWYILARQRDLLDRQLDGYHQRITKVLSLGMREPVWTMVPDLGRDLLKSVTEDERIVRVRVSSQGGTFLEEEFGERRAGTSRSLVAPIVYDSERIGEVQVEISTGAMERVLSAQRRRFLITTMVQLGLSLSIISLILRGKLVRPLQRLVRQSEQLARRELQEPFEWTGRDELGQLGQSFELTRQSLRTLFNTLQETNEELIRLNRGLESALAAKSVFLATMSHELRTPLNSIIGFSTVLSRKLEGQVDERHVHFLDNIQRSGEHLLRLVDDVLDLSKIDAGRMQLHPEVLDLAAELEGICGLVRAMAEKKSIRVELEVAADLPQVYADPARLKQIVYHLLANAIKFSPKDSAVTVRARRVEPEDSPLLVEAIGIEVEDRGIGIAPEHQQVIFEEFRQLDDSPGRKYEGTGLGLALVKKLLEIQGGTIEVRSEPGHGSTFNAYLPLALQG